MIINNINIFNVTVQYGQTCIYMEDVGTGDSQKHISFKAAI